MMHLEWSHGAKKFAYNQKNALLIRHLFSILKSSLEATTSPYKLLSHMLLMRKCKFITYLLIVNLCNS